MPPAGVRGQVCRPESVGCSRSRRPEEDGRCAGGFRLEIVGAERVPSRGPVVLAMNHESALDVPLAVVACPRPITFMSKKDLYKNALGSWALHELGGFRVDRHRFDLTSVRIAVAAVQRGDVLGMYPEGTRSLGTLLPFLPGAAWLALAMGAPLVPCAISGTDRTMEELLVGRGCGSNPPPRWSLLQRMTPSSAAAPPSSSPRSCAHRSSLA